jgi:ATP-binding cassette subfamily B protein
VTTGITTVEKSPLTEYLIFLLIAAALVSLFTASLKSFSSYGTEAQSLTLIDKITDMIHLQSIRLDLSYYDNSDFQNTLHLAQNECIYRPRRILNSTLTIGQNLLSIGTVGYLLFSFSPISGAVIICSAIPAVFIKFWTAKRLYALRFSQTEIKRKNWYFHVLLTGEHYAKEVRLFSLGRLFIKRFLEIQQSLRDSLLALYRIGSAGDMIAQGFITLAMFGSFTFIAIMTVQGKISTGDMVMYFMGFQMCIGYVESILLNMSFLYEDQLFLNHLFGFLDLEPEIIITKNPVPIPNPMSQGIRFYDVTFSYPGENRPVLHKINLSLHKGEIIALVGNNGAGKSTLINLLCRLYDPDSGRITMDGTDITQFDPEEWRTRIAVLFQNFVRYQISSLENIGLADLNSHKGYSYVRQAALRAKIDEVISQLPEGYDTILGKFFSNGHELSGGEWQKIALARVFFRDSEIIILDEPTSSLDVYTEAEIIQSFKEIAEGHTVILTSHRLSTVMMADQIYVMEEGTIVEHGTHDELMEKNGKYARMFRIQAEPYINRETMM